MERCLSPSLSSGEGWGEGLLFMEERWEKVMRTRLLTDSPLTTLD
jgi:hypothetical protein